MIEYELGGTICRTAKFRTPTTIIIFKLVTKPNMVEFVFMDSKLAEMARAQVARRQMVRTLVKYDNIEPSTGKSDCFLQKLLNLSFALSQWQQQ